MDTNRKIIRSATVAQSCGFFMPMIPDLQKNGYTVVALTSPGPELNEVDAMGARTIALPMERRFAIGKDLVSLIRMIRIFRKEKPYMVHSMTPKAGLLCMMAGWICGVPRRVHTFTGLVWPTETGMSRRILMLTDWITCFCATHVIPEGKGVKDDLQQHITRKPMRVLGYGNVRGVDLVRFSRRPEVMSAAQNIKKEGVFTFLFVGRIVGAKGINELVEAFERLMSSHGQARLLLVGKMEDDIDPVKDETRKKIDEIPQIEAVGPHYGEDLLAYYAASDCFVFPSYREGFPNTVMEAGAMGLPSIVTDINGSREIIEHGTNGLIVPSKDTDALLHAMIKILEDAELRGRLSSQARGLIESRFERGFVKQCLLDFYNEIM